MPSKRWASPADNLKTTGFYMSPNYDVKGSKGPPSYTVTNSLTVKSQRSQPDFAGHQQKPAALGANQIDNIRFTNEHSDQIKDNLIKEAVHNGQRAAQAAAAAAGNQLGAVKEINISGSSPSYSRAYSNVRMLSAKMEDAETTPVEAGTNTLSQTVSLTYYLK